MAGQAIGSKDGKDFILEVDRFVSLHLGDLEFRPRPQGKENQKGEQDRYA
jgi:hypothetical protein